MNKLELKHIAPYLPYQLKVIEVYNGKQVNDEFIVDCVNWNGGNIGGSDASLDSFELERAFNLRDIKPILRPMSDLFKLIDWDNNSNPYMLGRKMGLIQIIEDGNPLIVEELYAEQCESPGVCLDARYCNWWLFEHHFDVFGLIEKGLAIKKESEVDND